MGVLKSKRKESQLFVYDTYRKYATELLRTLSACLSAERFKNLNNFQLRFFDREIFYLQDDLHNIANEILQANSIYPTNELEEKVMTLTEIQNNYKSWRNSVKKFDCYNQICLTDKKFIKIFGGF